MSTNVDHAHTPKVAVHPPRPEPVMNVSSSRRVHVNCLKVNSTTGQSMFNYLSVNVSRFKDLSHCPAVGSVSSSGCSGSGVYDALLAICCLHTHTHTHTLICHKVVIISIIETISHPTVWRPPPLPIMMMGEPVGFLPFLSCGARSRSLSLTSFIATGTSVAICFPQVLCSLCYYYCYY